MRDSLGGPFTIIKLVGENAVEVRLREEFSRKHKVIAMSLVTPYFQTPEDTPSRILRQLLVIDFMSSKRQAG
ncbi:hypothetical protein O181_010374 [Austropuccinia psidii MF-1]|uniref:Uncharacterized protein n=1 Tax=Austropuccinia psidii MF-1 TaxID=1389203 RepID=A0A9Q3BSH6_9BASI|nr:hypothetical protein [Austropuccinia psidii MF-1]